MSRSELASRIWRSVVFSGAVLGGSAVADIAKKPAEKPAVKKVDSVASVRLEIEKLDNQILVELVAFVEARDDAARKAAAARLEPLRKDAAALDVRMKAVAPTGEPTPYAKIVERLIELDAQFVAGLDALRATTTADARTAAHMKLQATHKQLLAAELKLSDGAKAARPRTPPPEEQRPVGRGFVLA